jgi:hypothetical protein
MLFTRFYKIIVLLILCLYPFFLNAYAPKYDYVSIYYTAVQPSVIPELQGSVVLKEKKKFFHGGGLSYNNVRADYVDFFEGYKVSVNYDMFLETFATPYLGVSYIDGADDRYFRAMKQYLNGYDFAVGGYINFWGFVKPYVEYNLRNSYFNYGVMVSIPIKIKHRDKKVQQ